MSFFHFLAFFLPLFIYFFFFCFLSQLLLRLGTLGGLGLGGLGVGSGSTLGNQANRVYVGSLHYDIDESIVRVPFSAFGTIVKIDMPRVCLCRSLSKIFYFTLSPVSGANWQVERLLFRGVHDT